MSTFAAPASTQGIDWASSKGHLLIVTPLSVETGVATVHGPTDAVRTDITDVDTEQTYTDVLVFPKVLQGQIRSAIGKQPVLGRLSQGVAKPGQSAPWTLADTTADDIKKAEALLAKQKTGSFSEPATGGNAWANDAAPF